jgi:hypothetical protein
MDVITDPEVDAVWIPNIMQSKSKQRQLMASMSFVKSLSPPIWQKQLLQSMPVTLLG